MSARTHDSLDSKKVICYRRGDYVLRLVLHGLRVYATGLLFYPLCGTGYVPVITWHPPVWWATEARSGFQLLDAARQADALGPA